MPNSSALPAFDTYGELLRHLRRRAQMTQRDFGLAVGYSEAHITRLENGQRLPDITAVKGLFVEALDLKREPELVHRLIELATKARGDVSLVQHEREASARARTNLPAPLTSFIGRAHEMAEVKALLGSARLLTLIGAGGVGKTRLAQQTAAVLLDANVYADGVWVVELAALADWALVSQSVAATLKLTERPGRAPLDAVVEYFAGKQALLILDNCEHLIAACADLAVQLLQRCPGLHLLATSRETLRVPGEVVYRVPSLSFPDPQQLPPVERLLEFEAVRLFVDRTHGTLSDFTLTARNAETLAQVCQRLDGIPLAIELAAARMNVMSVEQIAARLDDRFHLLTGGSRAALPQHKTLRALIDWSYDLLTEAEQTMLRRLSVFAGGWTLEAAESIADFNRTGVPSIENPQSAIENCLDVLTQLVNKSLVTVEREDVEQTRYRLLETIRQYAQDRLLERGEVELTRDQHLNYFLQLAERAEPELRLADQIVWLDRLEAELSNFRAALEWAVACERHIEAGLRLGTALMWFWHIRDHKIEGIDWLERMLLAEACGCGVEPRSQERILARTQALNTNGFLLVMQGNLAKQKVLSEESFALSRELGPNGKRSMAFALWNLSVDAENQQDYDRSRVLSEESLMLYREAGDKFGIAESLLALGQIALLTGDYERANAMYEESLAHRKEMGDQYGMAATYHHLAYVAILQVDVNRAAAMYEEILPLYTAVGNKSGMVSILIWLGRMALAQGNHEQAVGRSKQALALAQDIPDRAYVAEAHKVLGEIALSQGEYEQAAWHDDEALTLDREHGDKSMSADVLYGLGQIALAQGDPEQATERFEEALTIGRNLEVEFNIAIALSGLAQVAQTKGDCASAYALCKEVLVLLHGYARPMGIGSRAQCIRGCGCGSGASPSEQFDYSGR